MELTPRVGERTAGRALPFTLGMAVRAIGEALQWALLLAPPAALAWLGWRRR